MDISYRRLFEVAEKEGKHFKGRSEYLKYLKGEDLTASRSIKAKCYECMGMYADGGNDCLADDCPLYPFMPFSSKKRTVAKKFKRELTEEQKKQISERLQKARKDKNEK